MDALLIAASDKHLYVSADGYDTNRTALPFARKICAYGTGVNVGSITLAPPVEEPADASLYARVGALLGLKSALRSEVDLMERLEKGLPVSSLRNLRSRAGLTDTETFELIAPRRTLARREALRQLLSREEADKTVRVARVTARAQQVFGGKPDYATEWLRTAQSALGDRTPMQALVTESGALAVEELLVGIEHGMFEQGDRLAFLAARVAGWARRFACLGALAHARKRDPLLCAEPRNRSPRDSGAQSSARARGTRPAPLHRGGHPRRGEPGVGG